MTDSWATTEACTLPTAEQPLRVAEFDALFAESLRDVERVSGTRVRLTLDAASEETAKDLTARETSCCSFFTFAFAGGGEDRLTLEVSVPAAYADVLSALTGRAVAAAGLPA
jgi:hypothetical protein